MRFLSSPRILKFSLQLVLIFAFKLFTESSSYTYPEEILMFFSGIADEAGADIDSQIEAHRELGWKHIELRNVNGVNAADLCDEEFEAVAGKVAEAGLGVSGFGSQLCNWSRPIIKHPDIDAQELKRAIPRMHELGCKYIRIMSYPNAGWPQEKWRREVIDRISRLAAIAEEGGVVLVHENCNGWAGQGPDEALELVESVGKESLKLLWDTGNPVAHDQDPWKFYNAVRDHVVYVHIKDAIKKQDGGVRFTFPGEGDGQVGRVVADLKKRDYKGGLSIEPHLAAIIHEGKEACAEEDAYSKYIEYGRRLMELVDRTAA